LGKELYDRLAILGSHFEKLGSQLGNTVATYNKAVGSLESRVLVTARKFRDCGISESSTPLDDINPVEQLPRLPQASELTQPPSLAA
jgi:DNA recombination protein RmuC